MDEWQQKINIVLSRGYSQHQYAHATGMSQKTVSRIVRGETDGSKYADSINEALATLPQRPRRAKKKLQQQKMSTALIPSPRVQMIATQLRAMQNNAYRIQEVRTPAPASQKPARPGLSHIKQAIRGLIPERAASQQVEQAPSEIIESPMAYYAYYRGDPWPIGVPVNMPIQLEYKIKLGFPRTPDRWTQ